MPSSSRFTLSMRAVLITLSAATIGCLPDSFLITPVSANREMQEEVLYTESWLPAGKVAIIDVEGILLNVGDEKSLLTPSENPVSELLEKLDAARRDPRVKAVVLRINSPGGAVTAAELMHHEVLRLRAADKPVVAIMMDVGASGGYYVACAADEIMACRSTVTGSIGVVMQTFDLTGTMNKIGVKADAIKSGPMKAAGSPFQEMTPEQRAMFQGIVEELYTQFIEVVDTGRPKLDRDKVLELADGRVYTAEQALENGLIDRIGTMQGAIDRAKELAGIGTAKVVAYARPYGFVPNYYAGPASPPSRPQVNLLNVDLKERLGEHRPPFMYLWLQP